MTKPKSATPEKLEQAFERLEEIVARLEGGDVALEESLELYTEGMTLVKFCNEKLGAAREKIEKLSARDDAAAGDA